MKSFRHFTIVAIVATFVLIFVGGLVRVSGAGMGCPDWPTCFGRWIPPTDISQLPPDIDPAQFNFALAWIEYVNRLIGMIVGIFIAITAIWVLLKHRKHPNIVIASSAAAILVAYQGWQGSRMIASHLDPLLVSIHMGLAFIIVSLMIYVALQSYYIEKGMSPVESSKYKKTRYWLGGLIFMSIYQIIQGTQVRTGLELAAEKYPLLQQSQFFSHVGLVGNAHVITGVITAMLAWHVGAVIFKRYKSLSTLTTQITWSAIILAALLVIIGGVLIALGVPDILQIFHLVLSSLFLGMLVLLWTALKYEGGTK